MILYTTSVRKHWSSVVIHQIIESHIQHLWQVAISLFLNPFKDEQFTLYGDSPFYFRIALLECYFYNKKNLYPCNIHSDFCSVP